MTDALPSQVANAADVAMGEQLITAGMHAGKKSNRYARIDRGDPGE